MAGIEVLGAVAGVAQLASGCVDLMRTLSEVFARASHAPESIRQRKLHNERLREIIEMIKNCPPLQTDPVSAVLLSISEDLKALQVHLDRLILGAGDSKAKRVRKALSWVQREKQILFILGGLEEKETQLILYIVAISADQRYSTDLKVTNVQTDLNQAIEQLLIIHNTTAKVADNTNILPEFIEGRMRSLPVRQNPPAEVLNNFLSISNENFIINGKIDSLQSQIAPATDSLEQKWLPHPHSAQNDQVVSSSDNQSDFERVKVDQIVPNGNEGEWIEPTFNNLPSSRVLDFVGREVLLREVDLALCRSKSTPKCVVLLGLGGSGKTQLAMKYCQKRSSQGFTILWTNAASEESLKQSFGILAEILSKGPMSMAKFAGADSRVCYVMDILRRSLHRWILVFDNYDIPSEFENISAYIPNGEHGEIIVTSRHGDSLRLGDSIAVGGMNEMEALELLLRRTRLERTSQNDRHGKAIVRRLGYLALAIDQAGSYIDKKKLLLCEFREHYDRQRKSVLEYTPQLWEYKRSLGREETESRLSVFTTWDLSFQQLETCRNSKEMDLILLAGFMHHNVISEETFQAHYEKTFTYRYQTMADQQATPTCFGDPADFSRWIEHFVDEEKGWDSLKFREALIGLNDVHLIQEFSAGLNTPCKFSLHPLVSDWIKLRGRDNDYRQYYTREIIHMITNFLDAQDFSKISLEMKQEIMGHVDECLYNGKVFLSHDWVDDPSLHHAAVSFGHFYYEQGRYKDAEDLFRRVSHSSEARLGHGHPETLEALHNLAKVCHSQGYHTEAEMLYTEVLQCREVRSEADHPNTLDTAKDLANIYSSQGRYSEAEALYQKVIEGYKTQLGYYHLETLKASLRLACNTRSKGEYSEAEKLYQEAVSGLEVCVGNEHPATLAAVDDFANNYQSQGRYVEAEKLYLRALRGREAALGQAHPDTLWTIANLANNYRSQGRYDEAESSYVEALACNKTQLGHDHPETLWIMDGLGVTYHDQGRHTEAVQLLTQVLVGRQRRLGDNHHNTLRTLNNLANVYQSQKLYEKAESLFTRTLLNREKHLGCKHPKTLQTVEDIATNFLLQERLADAETSFRRALSGRIESLGLNHPDTVRIAGKMIKLYRHLGRRADIRLLLIDFPLPMGKELDEF